MTKEKCDYPQLTTIEAAEKILRGEEIERCYIEALTVEAFKQAKDDLKTGNFTESGEIEIDGTKYKGPILNQPITCTNCLIGKIDFEGLIITGNADFSGTRITGNANFSEAIFSKEAKFGGVNFSGCAEFCRVIFNKQANFGNAIFGGNAHFNETTSGGYANFACVRFYQDANFTNAIFGQLGMFYRAFFKNNAHFSKTTCAVMYFRDANFDYGYANFEGASLSFVCFMGVRFEMFCNLRGIRAGALNFKSTILKEDLAITLIAKPGSELLEWDKQSILEQFKEAIGKVNPDKQQEFSVVLTQYLNIAEQASKDNKKRNLHSINFEDTLLHGSLNCDFESQPSHSKSKVRGFF